MKKRLLLFLCIFTLLLSTAAQAEGVTADVPAPAPSAEKADTLSPFARTRSYDGRFTDVDASAWYHDAVAALYEYGLTEGVSRTAYAPDESVTVAELTAFAARLRALDMGESVPAPAAGEAWYQSGVDYLKSAGALGDAFDGHYADAATRAQAAGILAPALRAERYDERNAEAVVAAAAETLGAFPVFVKPCSQGSSVGVAKANNLLELAEGLTEAFKLDTKVLVEEFIDGHEVECAVLGNERPQASTVGEIAPTQEFYTFDAKYKDESSRLYIPAHITPEQLETVRQDALRVYTALGCRGLSRVDFFVTHDGGEVVFNELNAIPGFTSISMYPKLFDYEGIHYAELLDRLIALALEEHHG